MMYMAAFFGMVLLDIIWAEYSKACAARRALWAGIMAIGIIVGSALLVLSYTQDPWLLVPMGMGAFVGTFTSVKWLK
jgi:hypothetical protein